MKTINYKVKQPQETQRRTADLIKKRKTINYKVQQPKATQSRTASIIRGRWSMAKKLPAHLKKMLDDASKTNKGRNALGSLMKATYFRSVEGKYKKVKY